MALDIDYRKIGNLSDYEGAVRWNDFGFPVDENGQIVQSFLQWRGRRHEVEMQEVKAAAQAVADKPAEPKPKAKGPRGPKPKKIKPKKMLPCLSIAKVKEEISREVDACCGETVETYDQLPSSALRMIKATWRAMRGNREPHVPCDSVSLKFQQMAVAMWNKYQTHVRPFLIANPNYNLNEYTCYFNQLPIYCVLRVPRCFKSAECYAIEDRVPVRFRTGYGDHLVKLGYEKVYFLQKDWVKPLIFYGRFSDWSKGKIPDGILKDSDAIDRDAIEFGLYFGELVQASDVMSKMCEMDIELYDRLRRDVKSIGVHQVRIKDVYKMRELYRKFDVQQWLDAHKKGGKA